MKNTFISESYFAGADQQVNNAIIEAVNRTVFVYNKHKTSPIPDWDIDDITQEAFKNAFRSLKSFDSSKSSIEAWASKIALNCIRDYWNDRAEREAWNVSKTTCSDHESYDDEEMDYLQRPNIKDNTSLDTIHADSDPLTDMLCIEQLDWLYDHIDRLPAKSKFIIEQSLERKKPRQVATMLGCTSNPVSIILHRAILALKKMAEDEHYPAA